MAKRFKDHDAPKAKLNKATLRKAARIFRYLKPYRAHFALMMVLLFITSGLSLVFPFLLGKLLDAGAGNDFWGAPLTDLTNIDSIAKLLGLTPLSATGRSSVGSKAQAEAESRPTT